MIFKKVFSTLILPSGLPILAVAFTHLSTDGVSLANPAGDRPHLFNGPKLATAIWVYLSAKFNQSNCIILLLYYYLLIYLPVSKFLTKRGPPESPLQ